MSDSKNPQPSASRCSFLQKYEIWWFFVTIVIANALFVTSVAEGLLPEGVYGMGRFALLGGVLAGIVLLSRGPAGVWEILKPMLEWRRSPLLYLFAVVWTMTIACLVLLGKGWWTGDHLQWAEVTAGLQQFTSPQLLVTLLVSSFVGEIVWVSYAVRALSSKFTHYVSALIVGVVWTAWWLPMAIHDFGIIPNLPIGALLFNQMGVAAMCAFVYFHTRSGFLVLVMQILFNGTILVLPVTPDAGGALTYWAFALVYFASASMLFFIFGPPVVAPRQKEGGMILAEKLQ